MYPRKCTAGLRRIQAPRQHYGSPAKFGYKDFIPSFRTEHFDPAAWARLFKEAGQSIVVPVFEHHDGSHVSTAAFPIGQPRKMGPDETFTEN